ncbi:MAG: YceI family protein [Kordiimonadaceae bacterium]|jgi:polyisoprenoid-binding protein YceI|nr:YceI family protein [Kordiimonadaceae bacterium]MDB4218738.1 YceI family protein [Emcibacteraceae bacterium]MBT6135373.1 YceI family protein [Kordiimonadaceae bacterium]MBT6467940.1 YceI family protein [Kordiimonadaceae bacterium]MBT7544146.1 YceI family protein [Kordiimonadaceae bacterium]|tara:strand:+ start:1571 stop:2164 length:594 start_codon:yes stop_codon:yes gene_type:complete
MTKYKGMLGAAAIFIASSLFSSAAYADWILDAENSNISYGTVKNDMIGENNTFKTISGHLNNDGQIDIEIDLSSIDTLIEIRDGRMRDIVFKVSENATAKLSGEIDLKAYDNQEIGTSRIIETTVSLELVGQKLEHDVKLLVTRLAKNKVMVTPHGVMFIDADDYDLVDAIEILRNLAGLDSIASVISMGFYLTFIK